MGEEQRLATAERLVNLARADWKYTDLYLGAAEAALSSVCSREQFREALARRGLVGRLVTDLRRAIRQGDWRTVEQLAREGFDARDQAERSARLLAVGEAVYGARSIDVSTFALAMSGIVAQSGAFLKAEITRLAGDLRALASSDASRAAFFECRAAELDRMIVDLPDDPPERADSIDLREAALRAASVADFSEVRRIARSATRDGRDRLGRIRAPRPAASRVGPLAEPIPDTVIGRAERLGLASEVLDPNDALNGYLSCRCSDRVALPARPLTEGHRSLEGRTCGHACPPEIGENLRSSVDALMVHPFLTSGGTRYLPWFGRETLLTEVFPEDEPDARTALLAALSMPRRRGLSRLAIEDSLLSAGPRVCEDIGLDPLIYRIVCIPFDAYQRLAARHGWGARALWTHFDGYQVTRDLRLQALVGGDARFGGPGDLCSVGRAYDSDHVTVRFAVVRRQRFEARAPGERTFGGLGDGDGAH